MKKWDKILLISISLFIVVSFGLIYGYRIINKDKKVIAVIKKEGNVIKRIDLNKVEKTEKIKIEYGNDAFNIIEVSKGKIRFQEANCPDEVCVKSGWLKNPGDSAACLPHKMIITLEGEDKSVDQVSY
ncbi:NusG domain II-containing protein [Haloimpatiens sp. FM7315]|uniref:NusG domain II-containing protein n=1 Tax=Haloimpatiens sp. FM7315 TaxID=3298609 RepID=UPI0035A39D9A